MNKKVLVTDYDKTLFTNEKDMLINLKTIDKFRNNGNLFIIASGRTYSSLKKEIDKYNIKYDYLILNHGSLVIDKNNNILFHFKLDKDIIIETTNLLKERNSQSIFYSYFLNDTFDIENNDISKITSSFKPNIEEFKNTMKILMKNYNKELNIYFTQRYEIEIISNKTNKSHAIELLMKKMNFKKENIYTIGDSYTDIKMINDYKGACMRNSIDILLSNTKINKYISVSDYINYILKN